MAGRPVVMSRLPVFRPLADRYTFAYRADDESEFRDALAGALAASVEPRPYGIVDDLRASGERGVEGTARTDDGPSSALSGDSSAIALPSATYGRARPARAIGDVRSLVGVAGRRTRRLPGGAGRGRCRHARAGACWSSRERSRSAGSSSSPTFSIFVTVGAASATVTFRLEQYPQDLLYDQFAIIGMAGQLMIGILALRARALANLGAAGHPRPDDLRRRWSAPRR